MKDKKKIEKVEDLSHAQKISKSLRDTRDFILLLLVLLVILCSWNIWVRHKINELKTDLIILKKVRQELDTRVTPEIARKLLPLSDDGEPMKDLRHHVKRIMANLKIKYVEKGNERIAQPKKDMLAENTLHESVTVPNITNIELFRLISFLTEVRGPQGNIWCTSIENLEPRLDEDGFAIVTDKNIPVYNIKRLKISRFKEAQSN
jgi:hypothetical protein